MPPWEGGDVGKVKRFFIPFPVHPNSLSLTLSLSLFFFFFFLFHSSSGITSLETWTFTKAVSSVSDCIQYVHQGLPDHDQEKPIHGSPQGPTRTKVCQPIGLLLGSLAYGARTHSCLRGTFVCGWILNFCWRGTGWKWAMSLASFVLTSPPLVFLKSLYSSAEFCTDNFFVLAPCMYFKDINTSNAKSKQCNVFSIFIEKQNGNHLNGSGETRGWRGLAKSMWGFRGLTWIPAWC